VSLHDTYGSSFEDKRNVVALNGTARHACVVGTPVILLSFCNAVHKICSVLVNAN
jgi:aspartate 1-decarboxylase